MITTTFLNVDEPVFFPSITLWIENVVDKLFNKNADVSYIFCSDDYLLDLNKKQLNHDYYTDIITFDLRETDEDDLLCEMYISLDRVLENAEEYNCTFAEELKRVMVHGLLHLSGLNDVTESEKKIMREAENKLIFNSK